PLPRPRALFRALGVLLPFDFVGEDLPPAFARRESRPFRQARMIRVALARKRDPGLAHLRGQRASVCAATRHIHAAINVVKDEGQFKSRLPTLATLAYFAPPISARFKYPRTPRRALPQTTTTSPRRLWLSPS